MPDDRLIPPPNSIEAEQAVLGALLLADDAMERIADLLSERDFYTSAHRTLFRHAHAIVAVGKALDVITLSDALARAGELDRIGGMTYLEALFRDTMSAANVEHYAKIVRDHAIRREVIAFAGSAIDLAYDRHSRTAPELLDEVQRKWHAVAEGGVAVGMARLGEVLPQVIADIESRAHDDDAARGFSTGIPELDAIIPGSAKKKVIVIASRPMIGKSTLALQCAVVAALKRKTVAIFSLEMTAQELSEKALAYVGSVHAEAMASGQMTADDWSRVNAGVAKLHDIPLHIDGSPRLTVAQIRAKARRMQRRTGLDLVIIDYLQLLEGHGDSRHEQVSAITRSLKILANELDCPVVALSQVNRKCEERTDKRPMLSDLRDSGSVEQDADVVLFIYRDEVYNPDNEDTKGRAEISIAKNRGGVTGRVYCTFVGQHSRFAPTSWRPTVQSRSAPRRGMEG